MSTGKDSRIAEFEFRPRCLQNYGDIVVAGGLHEDRPVGGLQRGLLAIYNTVTGQQVTRDLGDFINNSITLYSETNDKISAIVCNNDCSLYFLDIVDSRSVLSDSMRLDTPLNHAAISPDQKTIVACGDSPNITICNRKGNSGWAMSESLDSGSDSGFSAAWHSSGIMFGVAFQDGIARLYDVRSLKEPLTEIKSSCPEMAGAFRCLKFSNGCEDMLFLSEQMERVHVVDIRDFENHQVLTVPINMSAAPPTFVPELDQHNPQVTMTPVESDSVVRPYDQVIVDPTYQHRRNYYSSDFTTTAAATASYGSSSWLAGARYPNSNYEQSSWGISGLVWSEYQGGSLIVGTHSSIGVWKVDGWTRRTFPSYTIR